MDLQQSLDDLNAALRPGGRGLRTLTEISGRSPVRGGKRSSNRNEDFAHCMNEVEACLNRSEAVAYQLASGVEGEALAYLVDRANAAARKVLADIREFLLSAPEEMVDDTVRLSGGIQQVGALLKKLELSYAASKEAGEVRAREVAAGFVLSGVRVVAGGCKAWFQSKVGGRDTPSIQAFAEDRTGAIIAGAERSGPFEEGMICEMFFQDVKDEEIAKFRIQWTTRDAEGQEVIRSTRVVRST